MIELAMPAGSMQCALVAFRDGTDAVYLGLQSYSARKGAINFSIIEYSKIFAYAHAIHKKVYVTINTVIFDAQIPSLIKLVKQIQLIGSDGLIVQDLGLARIINNHFPSLELHGSTQLAVHSIEGVKAMQAFGFKRVVLSRELTIEEIEKIRTTCDDVELKVFIHGSLCYGFSGLCMASRLITKRSANAGACAQICRTWFSYNNRDGYFFSMKDLDAAQSVKKLQDINIDSLKVEGRMKSPAYVSAVTKYYRAILDNQPIDDLYENVKTTFSRESSKGWLDNYNNQDKEALVETTYPSHIGLLCAQVVAIRNYQDARYALIELDTDLAIHDGIMFLSHYNGIEEATKFSVSGLLDVDGRVIKRANKFNQVYLLLGEREKTLQIGDDLYLIKKHDQDEKNVNTDRLALSKNYFKANFIVEEDSIIIEADLKFLNSIKVSKEIKIEQAKKIFDYSEKIEAIFNQSGDSFFECESITLINNTEFASNNIFLPLSVVKELRRAFYSEIDDRVELYINEELPLDENVGIYEIEELPNRSLISVDELPFFDTVPTEIDQLIKIDDKYYLPLPPVFFNEAEQIDKLKILIEKLKGENLIDRVYFGLNNIAHIQWLKPFDVKVYADIYYYLANREAAMNLLATKLKLVGAYLFLETVKGDVSLWPFTPTRVDEEFVPPLFISRSNFSFDSLGEEKKEGTYSITQREKKYKVISKNELTYLIKRN